MAILNYTTSIKTEKTASEIQSILVKAGATAILNEYSPEGWLTALSFKMNIPDVVCFRLPINIDGVYAVLCNDNSVPKGYKNKEQAARTAWRIIKTWVSSQLAIIEAGQAEIMQVFLPYAQNKKGKTVYELYKDNHFLMITQEIN